MLKLLISTRQKYAATKRISILIATIAIWTLTAPLSAAPFRYTREATPESITVGDLVDIHLSIVHQEDIRVTPDPVVWPETFQFNTVHQTQSVSGNLITDTWHYKVAIFEPGEQTIPEAIVRQTLANGMTVAHKLPAITVNVVSILPANTATVGGLKPLLAPALTLWPWLLGLGCIALVVWGLWKYKRSKVAMHTVVAEPLLSPKEEALLAIETLTSSGIIDRQDYKAACLSMTEILKRFLSRHYHQKMQEMTSEEVSNALQSTSLDIGLLKRIRILLRNCDQIKFANSSSSQDYAYGLCDTLRNIISEIASTADSAAEGDATQP